MGYIVVLDTSGSIHEQRFEKIRTALKSFVASTGPKDKIALLAFADSVQSISDFTGDKKKIADSIGELRLTGTKSLLHLALFRAFEFGARRDADLPLRRAIIVASDGKDEGSGLADEDVLEKARSFHIPMYAVGYSALPNAERRRYLDVLHRFAIISGGDYAEPGETNLDAAFDGVRTSVARVYAAKFQCSACAGDGARYHLEVQLNGKKAFSDGMDVPVPARVSTPPKPVAWWIEWRLQMVGSAVLLALAALVWRFRRKRAGRKSPEPGIIVDSQPFGPPTGASRRPDPSVAGSTPTLNIMLTSIRGSRKGITYEMRMRVPLEGDVRRGKAIIGRRDGCDLVLEQDEAVSGQHCLAIWNGSRLIVRDLDSVNGTFVNGVRLAGDLPVESGDLIGIGQSEYRISIPEDSL